MSKSKNNVVDPVAIIDDFGADTARWFVLSDSPPERDVEWTASGVEAANRHLNRVYKIVSEIIKDNTPNNEMIQVSRKRHIKQFTMLQWD